MGLGPSLEFSPVPVIVARRELGVEVEGSVDTLLSWSLKHGQFLH